MNFLACLKILAEVSVSQRLFEGCKTACQYAVDRLQTTFNSMMSLFPLMIVAAGLLIYLVWKQQKKFTTANMDGPPDYSYWKIPALVALGITLLRFVLEKMSAPEALAEAVGIGWFTYVVAIYLALRVRYWRELLVNLALFILAARIPIVILMVLASYLHWGTHYDISSLTHLDTQWGRLNYQPNSFRQHLHLVYLAQLVIMPLYSWVTGLMAGAVVFSLKTLRIWRHTRNSKSVAMNSH